MSEHKHEWSFYGRDLAKKKNPFKWVCLVRGCQEVKYTKTSENIEECTCSSVGEMFFDPDKEDSPDQCSKCGGVVNIKNIEPLRTELLLRDDRKVSNKHEERAKAYIVEILNPKTTKERVNDILNEIFEDEEFAFRKLSPKEEKESIEYAEQNDPPSMEGWKSYHPIIRKTWIKRGIMPDSMKP